MKEQSKLKPKEFTQNYQNNSDQLKLFEIPNCSICLMELSSGQQALGCGHVFHHGCLKQNSKYRSQCPICKASINTSIKLFYHTTDRRSYIFELKQGLYQQIREKYQKIEKQIMSWQKIHIQNSQKIINKEIQNAKLLKESYEAQKKIQHLQKENRQVIKKLENLNKKFEDRFKINQLILQPNQFIKKLNSNFVFLSYSNKKLLDECQELLMAQKLQILKEKNLNQELKKQLQSQSRIIKYLNLKIQSLLQYEISEIQRYSDDSQQSLEDCKQLVKDFQSYLNPELIL